MNIQSMLASSERCSGCAVCSNICKNKAIEMLADSKGFLHPVVNSEKCIECQECVKECPIENELEYCHDLKAYAVRNCDDEIRKISSSGGVFFLLAKKFIDLGGCVYGASFDKNWRLRHVRVEDENALNDVCRSKYVQSDMGDVYVQIEKDILSGRYILFSGTPCQTEAVFRYIEHKHLSREKVLLCDLFCHGVPSPKIWSEYVELINRNNDSNLKTITFRDKINGWHARSGVRYQFDGDNTSYFDRRFTELFIDNYSLRSSCFNCKYTSEYRCSDITLGDFWGIEKTELRDMDDDLGVSAVIAHTVTGKEWIENLDNVLIMDSDIQSIKTNQQSLNCPFSKPERINDFWRDYYNLGFKYVTEKYVNKNMLDEANTNQCNVKSKFWVILPDGSGSLGDEAMVRGVSEVLGFDDITYVSPAPGRTWRDYMVDWGKAISEIALPMNRLSDAITSKGTVLILGADVMDGTCGLDSSIARLECVKKCLELGGSVHVFCSFRSDVKGEIIERIKEIGTKAKWHFRDEISINNFNKLTGLEGDFFPDMAFFCKSQETFYSEKIVKRIKEIKSKGKTIVGISFSQQSCDSFFKEFSVSSWNDYVFEAIASVKKKISNPFFVLISHDVRKWDTHLSDEEFQNIAAHMLDEDEYLSVKAQVSYPELLVILKELDFLISGRMHLAVAGFRSGIVPIVYTGDSKDGLFSMAEKVRGMYLSRIGRTDLVANNIQELEKAIDILVQEKSSILQELLLNNINNEKEELRCLDNLRTLLNIEQHDAMSISIEEKIEILEDRFKTECRELRMDNIDLKSDHEKLQESIKEKEKLLSDVQQTILEQNKVISRQNRTIERQKQYIRNKEGHIEQLLEVDRKYQNILHSKGWRMISFPGRLFEQMFPPGTPRRARISFCVKCVNAINLTNFKFLLNAFKKNGLHGIVREIDGFIHRGELPVMTPVVFSVDEIDCIDDCEKLSFVKEENPKVSIVIPVYNQFTYTYYCLKSILENTKQVSYEIIIADDVSNDLTTRLSEIAENITIVRNKENQRFLRNCNNAARYAKGQYILFLNNDTQVQENWLEPLVSLIESDNKVGMVGSKLIYPDGTLQEAGGIIWRDGSGWNYGNGDNPLKPEYSYVKEVDYISGAAIMIKSSLWNEIGGFDDYFAPAYCEDSDLAFEVRKHGYKVLYQPLSVVIHFEGKSNGTSTESGVKRYQVANSKKLYKKWKTEFDKQSKNELDLFRARERSQQKKVILVIDHYVPQFDKDAGSKTTWQYLKMFVNQGYSVKFLGDNFFQDEPYTTALQQIGVEVLYGPWYAQNYKQWIIDNQNDIDFVYLNRPHITEKYIDFLRNETNIKCIYYGHDLHFLRVRREYELNGDEALLKESEDWKSKEFEIMRKADINYYPSYVEIDEIHKIDPTIPAKAITAYVFEKFREDISLDFAKKNGILFVGGFGHPPNEDAVLWFAEQIYPLIREKQDIPFYIVGSKPTDKVKKLNAKGIVLKGFVSEEELQELYDTCKLVVVPLRYGAGVKGKVIEALYNGTPMVSTTVGIEGIKGAEKFMEVADDPEEFANKVLALYNDNEKLIECVNNYQAYVKKNNSIDAVWNIVKDDFQ